MDIEQRIDPELRSVFAAIPQEFADFTINPVALRKIMSELLTPISGEIPKSVKIEDRSIPGPKDSPNVPIRIYAPFTRTEVLPGLLWFHGGGFMIGDLNMGNVLCQSLVEEVGCVVVSVDYRLAPENPFPAGVEDCYAALCWMVSSAMGLKIDTSRIAVGGTSAGGGLAAAVALMARDRKGPKLAFQGLIYPCLDDRHTTWSSHAIKDRRTFNREVSLKMWKAYLGSHHKGEVSPYAAPSRASDLSGLPPAYVLAAELDLLCDENIEYAMRLMQAGVTTELHVFPGTFHAFFDIPALSTAVSRRAVSEYIAALKHALIR